MINGEVDIGLEETLEETSLDFGDLRTIQANSVISMPGCSPTPVVLFCDLVTIQHRRWS